MSEAEQPPATQPPAQVKPAGLPARILNANLGSAAAILASTFVVLKLLAVAHFDHMTAVGLLAEGATGTVVIGALLPALRVVVLVALLLTIDVHRRAPTDAKPASRRGCLALGAVVVALTPPPALLWLAILLVFLLELPGTAWMFSPLLKAGESIHSARIGVLRQKVLRFLMVTYAVIATLIALRPEPWLPSERIVPEGKPAVVGYVVRSSPESTVVLVHRSRNLLRIEGRVTRTFCRTTPPSAVTRPLLSYIWRTPSYPRCDS